MTDSSWIGSGLAFVVGSKCNKLIPFTSSVLYTWSGDTGVDLGKIDYNNSFIGSRTLSSIYSAASNTELSSDGTLNFTTNVFYDIDTDTFFIYVTITGLYKKCKYASEEIDILITPASASSSANAASVSTLKKKSKNSDEFHKLLDSNPNLKKKYLQLKAKLGK
jgi:hypothetical protein